MIHLYGSKNELYLRFLVVVVTIFGKRKHAWEPSVCLIKTISSFLSMCSLKLIFITYLLH
jgi:hypothetical protein